ncbi:hypothetical protein BH23GEM11_BH23GEM11_09720 [soil metagenome]
MNIMNTTVPLALLVAFSAVQAHAAQESPTTGAGALEIAGFEDYRCRSATWRPAS